MIAPLVTARSLEPGKGRGAERADFPFGLARAGVHEIAPAAYGDLTAACGFALAAGAARQKGAGVWVRSSVRTLDHGGVTGAGLASFGDDPGRWLLVEARKPVDALWAIEEAIRSSACSLVIGEAEDADFTATRRLSLAAARHGTAVLLILRHGREGATAAQARWRISPQNSGPNRYDTRAVGTPRWRAVLERAREAPGAVGRAFDLEFDHETLSLRMVQGLAARPVAPGKAGDGDGRIVQPFRKTG